MESGAESDDHEDFQTPLFIPSFKRKVETIEEEEEEMGDVDRSEQNACAVCRKKWNTTGMHRLIQLKCGHLFGKSCIDQVLRTAHMKSLDSYCPLCCDIINKRDIRAIWPQSILLEDPDTINQLQSRVEEARKTLQQAEYQRGILQEELLLYKTELTLAKNKEAALMNLAPIPILDVLPDIRNQFKLKQNFQLNTEKYRVMTIVPNHCMAVISVHNNHRYGLRKVNLMDTSITDYIDNHHGLIRDVKHSLHEELLLSTGLDKTIKLTSYESNNIVLSYALNVPGWSCSFDNNDSNLFYCGLANNTMLMFDTRNISKPILELKEPRTSTIPIHSLNVCNLYDKNLNINTILCSNLTHTYAWNITHNGSENKYIPIPNEAGYKPFSTYYENNTLFTSLRNASSTKYLSSHNISINTEEIEMADTVLFEYSDYKQTSLSRNIHFEQDGTTVFCIALDNKVIIRTKDEVMQELLLNKPVIDIKHSIVNNMEILSCLSENELRLFSISTCIPL